MLRIDNLSVFLVRKTALSLQTEKLTCFPTVKMST